MLGSLSLTLTETHSTGGSCQAACCQADHFNCQGRWQLPLEMPLLFQCQFNRCALPKFQFLCLLKVFTSCESWEKDTVGKQISIRHRHLKLSQVWHASGCRAWRQNLGQSLIPLGFARHWGSYCLWIAIVSYRIDYLDSLRLCFTKIHSCRRLCVCRQIRSLFVSNWFDLTAPHCQVDLSSSKQIPGHYGCTSSLLNSLSE